MNMKQIGAIVAIVMLGMAVATFVDAPTKRNLKTVVIRSLPLL
jgi:hypothetical protein